MEISLDVIPRISVIKEEGVQNYLLQPIVMDITAEGQTPPTVLVVRIGRKKIQNNLMKY